MNDAASVSVLAAFVVFSRVGACLLLMPGFSSPRIPVQVRLFIAVAVALALTPLQIEAIRPIVADGQPMHLLRLMGSELFIGAAIGLFGRVFFTALGVHRRGGRHVGGAQRQPRRARRGRRDAAGAGPRC